MLIPISVRTEAMLSRSILHYILFFRRTPHFIVRILMPQLISLKSRRNISDFSWKPNYAHWPTMAYRHWPLSPLPCPLSSLFVRVLLIRYDVSIKLQSKREEMKSVLCVWRAANYARRQNNEGGSRFPRLPAANYSFSRSVFVTLFRADINKSSLKLLLHCRAMTEASADFDVEIFTKLPIVRAWCVRRNYIIELLNVKSARKLIKLIKLINA